VSGIELHDTPDAGMETGEILASREAGGRAIRGSAMRFGGYALGAALIAVASIFLLRHLGVVDFGRYVTVMSLLAIVGGVTDAGLTLIGAREYVLQRTEGARRSLLADLVGMRIVFTPIGVLLAAGFAAVAGYPSSMVIGTLVAGVGLVIANVAATMTVPLTANLRFGALSTVEVAKNATTAAGVAALVLLGSGLLGFFAVNVAAGVAALVVTVAFAGAASWVAPRMALNEWKPLLREAAPVAASQIVNVVYLRVLVVLMSLLATGVQTGLFATSYRVIEMILGAPVAMIGAAFPILAHAAATEEDRLSYALQRLGEATLLAAGAVVIVLCVAAEPIVVILGGDAYRAAAPVLQIQAFALLGASMTQVWTYGLIALHKQRSLILMNAIALAAILVLGLTLIPLWDAKGAALAASIGETILAGSALVFLVRARPTLRPETAYVWKLLVAGAVATGIALIPGVPIVATTVVALAAYVGVAFLLGAVPLELVHAFRRRRG
jgi:O-antigen/teichoic acid export membrane protein